jgi:hypothetical protein
MRTTTQGLPSVKVLSLVQLLAFHHSNLKGNDMASTYDYCKSMMQKSVRVWYAAKEKYGEDHEKTHRARGIVRGSATMLLTLQRPADRNNKIHVERLEQQFGMPGPAKGVYALADSADTRTPDVEAARARNYNDR